jgi:hypothetical protein
MKIVIIGGVAAGAKAAAKSRRILPDAEIDIYTQDTHVSYSACGLPYYIQGNFEDWRKLIIRSVDEFEKTGIHIHLLNRSNIFLNVILNALQFYFLIMMFCEYTFFFLLLFHYIHRIL